MFKHKLNFKSIPEIGILIISEPVGFDKQGFIIKQDPKYFGRNIFIGKEESDFTFSKQYFEQCQTIQILPNGDVIDHNSQGFFYLRDVLLNLGWEAEIDYIIEKDNVEFIVGILDGFTAEIQFDLITIKSIQNTNRELITRLEDTDIDAFSDKALDDRTIDPVETIDILLKAKPIYQESTWKYGLSDPKEFVLGSSSSFNFANQIQTFGIDNTLSYIQGASETDNFRYVFAREDLSEFKIEVTNLDLKYIPNAGLPNAGSCQLLVRIGDDVDTAQVFVLGTINAPNGQFNQTYTFEFPQINRGNFIWLYFRQEGGAGRFRFTSMNVKMSCISTAVNTIVKGTRLIDVVKHNLKSLADVQVIANEYESGGAHYDNFAFNGLLLGQITDKPFYNKFKDLKDIFLETCNGHQINKDSVEFAYYTNFFSDELLAEYDELPSFDSKLKQSKDYALKNAEFKFKRSSENRETTGQNSIDDVHTSTQRFISDKVDGTLKVEFDHIRSAFLFEEARKRAFSNDETKSLQNDNSLFIAKCIPLAPNSQGSYGNVLLQEIDTDTNNLRVLNNDRDGNGINFNWNLLGFKVNDVITIDVGQNSGQYTVISIQNTVVELRKLIGVPTFEGQEYIRLRWFYTNVTYTNQTNEGYTLIEGVSNPDNYGNLDYSLGRIIEYWKPYLATATNYKRDGVIKTTSFLNNGNLVTRKIGESANVVDSGEIQNSSIQGLKKVKPTFKTFKVYSPFAKTLQLVEDVGLKKGYIKVKELNGNYFYGYPIELDYDWITEELIMELQEKYLGDYVLIDANGVKEIGGVYKNNLESFEINIIYLSLFDENGKNLIEPTDFKRVMINGVLYTDLILFTEALQNYIEQ